MMTSEKRLAELTAFENVLDTFGGDPARWPADKRERLVGFAADDRDAQRLLREAKALDALLSKAAGPPLGDTSALASRIAAAVANTAPGQPVRIERQQDNAASAADTSGVVIAWPRGDAGQARAAAPSAGGGMGSQPRRERVTGGWQTAALLAASLVLGVFVGAMDLVPAEVSQIVASATTGTEAPQAIAFLNGEGLLEILEEEFL